MVSAPHRIIILLILLSLLMGGMATKRVAGIVVFRLIHSNIEYLMLKPAKDGKDWSPPKGGLEEGEDRWTAALRETQEEVGYTVDDLHMYRDQQITVHQKQKNGKIKEVTYFLGRLKTPYKKPVLSHEHSEYHWVGKDEASSLYGAHGEFDNMFRDFDKKVRQNFISFQVKLRF